MQIERGGRFIVPSQFVKGRINGQCGWGGASVRFRQLLGEGPAGWALAFVPDGWRSEPGVRYDIRVDGVFGHNWEGPIEYSIEMVDCDAQ